MESAEDRRPHRSLAEAGDHPANALAVQPPPASAHPRRADHPRGSGSGGLARPPVPGEWRRDGGRQRSGVLPTSPPPTHARFPRGSVRPAKREATAPNDGHRPPSAPPQTSNASATRRSQIRSDRIDKIMMATSRKHAHYALERCMPLEMSHVSINATHYSDADQAAKFPGLSPEARLRLLRLPPLVYEKLSKSTREALSKVGTYKTKKAVSRLLQDLSQMGKLSEAEDHRDKVVAIIDDQLKKYAQGCQVDNLEKRLSRHGMVGTKNVSTSPITPSPIDGETELDRFGRKVVGSTRKRRVSEPELRRVRIKVEPDDVKRQRWNSKLANINERWLAIKPDIVSGEIEDLARKSLIHMTLVRSVIDDACQTHREEKYASWRGRIHFGRKEKSAADAKPPIKIVGYWLDKENPFRSGKSGEFLSRERRNIELPMESTIQRIGARREIVAVRLKDSHKRHILGLTVSITESAANKEQFRRAVKSLTDKKMAGVMRYFGSPQPNSLPTNLQMQLVPPVDFALNELRIPARFLATESMLFGAISAWQPSSSNA